MHTPSAPYWHASAPGRAVMPQRPSPPTAPPPPPNRPELAAEAPDGPAAPPRPPLAEIVERVRVAITAAGVQRGESRSLLTQAAAVMNGTQRQRRDPAALREELHASVAAYVRSLRADGLAAERVVVLVKGVVRESTPAELDIGDARDLMEDVVRWAIEVYYTG